MGTFTKKITRQWRYPTINPPAIGPSIGPTSPGIATKLIARTSSDFANVRARVSLPTGTIMAPPHPCRIRHATRTWMLLDIPQRNDPGQCFRQCFSRDCTFKRRSGTVRDATRLLEQWSTSGGAEQGCDLRGGKGVQQRPFSAQAGVQETRLC